MRKDAFLALDARDYLLYNYNNYICMQKSPSSRILDLIPADAKKSDTPCVERHEEGAKKRVDCDENLVKDLRQVLRLLLFCVKMN